jgi:hypothetical protein
MKGPPHKSDESPPSKPQQSVETPPAPKTHIIEPGEIAPMTGGSSLGVFAEMGRVHPAVFVPRTDDIGGPKWGRPSSEALILAKAEQDLRRGDPGMKKWEYAEELSNWLARHHKDEPALAASTILKNKTFSALWRKLVVEPRRRRRRR